MSHCWVLVYIYNLDKLVWVPTTEATEQLAMMENARSTVRKFKEVGGRRAQCR